MSFRIIFILVVVEIEVLFTVMLNKTVAYKTNYNGKKRTPCVPYCDKVMWVFFWTSL